MNASGADKSGTNHCGARRLSAGLGRPSGAVTPMTCSRCGVGAVCFFFRLAKCPHPIVSPLGVVTLPAVLPSAKAEQPTASSLRVTREGGLRA